MGGSRNLERRNMERPICRNLKIANITIAKDEFLDSFFFQFIFSFIINSLSTQIFNNFPNCKIFDFPNIIFFRIIKK